MNARNKHDLHEQLVEQLQLAHQIILNALAVMTSEQKARWGRANVAAGMNSEDGITGYHARQKVIERATGSDL